MHRLHLLRWATLPVGLFVTLAITQCVDSLSDDCTKTLTCGDEAQVTLDNRCNWRYPDGGLWTGGPTQDPVTRRWKWPDGTETDTQDFRCGSDGAGGADAGAGEPDCVMFGCDLPQQCDEPTRRCVECLDDSACAGNVPTGDAGAAGICDTDRQVCVRCRDNNDCASPAAVCKVYAEDTKRNECVECTIDDQCGPSEPVCDPSSNECTLRCTGADPGECSGSPDKSVCNTTRRLCVECVDGSNTCSGDTSQCNTTSNECVQCVNNAPCEALEQVCDTTSNRCVQCVNDAECTNVDGKPVCDTESNTCVACLNDTQCTGATASRCNTVANECARCTASTQCEGAAVCNTTTGACVQCTSNEQCMMAGATTQCELTSGTCVECTDSSQCSAADAARCSASAVDGIPNTCVGCRSNGDCGKLPEQQLCNTDTRICVECMSLANCSDRPNESFCSSGGACVPCAIDAHCAAVPNLKACLVAGADARCVECVDNADCVGNMGGPACKTSNGGAAAGPGGINECVECVSNADCTNPSASKCVQNECVPCTANADCNGIDSTPGVAGGTALPVCDAGACVECTGLQFQACGNGGNVCDSATRQCTEFPVGSAGTCGGCVSDAHCSATGTARCARQVFAGTDLGFFCFPASTGAAPGNCALTPFAQRTTVTTIDNRSASLCLLRQTTCAGFADFGQEECDDASDCGVANLAADGVCVEDNGVCSIPCAVNEDCLTPAPGSCLGGFCQLANND